MLRQLLGGQVEKGTLIQLLLLVPIILFSLSVHESAHGYVALRLGDSTARDTGRITLNPAKHFDPMGFLFLLFFGFGWAKPVPVNTRYMKNARWGFVLTSLAGPFSNILLAFLSALLLNISLVILSYCPNMGGFVGYAVALFFMLAVQLNVGYAVFNLLPIPPLDGSRLVTALLPRKLALFSFRYERYMLLVLLVLVYFVDSFTNVIDLCVGGVTGFIYQVVDWIPFHLLYAS